ncbi:MAG: hypothetical protein A3F89_04100 [Deltaproteobacteria bacterium RIFCSPLOWO2_12_FULL_50_11]|nr:MAG: hypothetical protein A3B79_01710 [Deltaproteobacteria bacterium RIFCSPHIGHO2_02_FULL_50_15]OGQ67646.1 MAG: hypothetical protein A3F89_04100 [Deltaproteobacteria bacterium RIFCSPLOWO2_12_FULL_50_11]
MFHFSSRSLYALRALYELALCEQGPPMKIAFIAQRQKIPTRFLEGILAQLKRGGIVESRRGVDGGYHLARRSQYLTIGEVLRFLEGPVDFTNSQKKGKKDSISGPTDPFNGLWQKLEKTVETAIDEMTFRDLIEFNERTGQYIPNYII